MTRSDDSRNVPGFDIQMSFLYFDLNVPNNAVKVTETVHTITYYRFTFKIVLLLIYFKVLR